MGTKVSPSTSFPASARSPTPSISSSSFSIPNLRKMSSSSIICRSNLSSSRSISGEFTRLQSSIRTLSRSSCFRRACRARLNDFPDEEISEQSEELGGLISDMFRNSTIKESGSRVSKFTTVAFAGEFSPPPRLYFPASIERRANRVDIPLSLRIIKKRQQKLEEGFKESGDFGFCSVKTAFSSMVFVVRELQKCALEMREALSYEDLQGVLTISQRDLNSSFVWIFQKVLSGTPALMVHVMILLADFAVHSVDYNYNAATAASSLQRAALTGVETETWEQPKFPSPGFVRGVSIDGNSGAKGGKANPVASGTEVGGWNRGSSSPLIQHHDNTNPDHPASEEVWNHELSREEEEKLWESTVEEARRMQGGSRAEVLDRGTISRLVAPVSVELEAEDFGEYYGTEVMYQMGLSQDPNNSLLLCNYAQFLFLVAHDHDRAEECFKRAVQIETGDAEALSKYADFLWVARKDLWGAEERYQQAVAAEPENSYISSKYASFLWSTGGEETCFLLNNPTTEA